MGLLDKLQNQGSTLSEFDGNTPPTPVGATDLSALHYEYSVNGVPFQPFKPEPSVLDLNGQTPPKYLDNPPR